MGFQSAVDAFQFHHWQEGKHLRALVYGCFKEERAWERVEGTPEAWELERIWKEAKIEPGMTQPRLNSRRCAHKIARIYGFPHYGK